MNLTVHDSEGVVEVRYSTHSTQYSTVQDVVQVRVRLVSAASLVLRYGAPAGRERARLLRHAARSVARRAWAREQDRVSGASPGELQDTKGIMPSNQNYNKM